MSLNFLLSLGFKISFLIFGDLSLKVAKVLSIYKVIALNTLF
uniref:Uncharacterized protein n=1 Tax=Heterorhabditis bacteriophora TaxID=37862 RepID=A0A1I7WHL4_HETBA